MCQNWALTDSNPEVYDQLPRVIGTSCFVYRKKRDQFCFRLWWTFQRNVSIRWFMNDLCKLQWQNNGCISFWWLDLGNKILDVILAAFLSKYQQRW